MRLRLALACATLLATAATRGTAAEPRRSIAVLEYRAGVEKALDATQHLADRLKKLAALTVVDPLEARRRRETVDADLARCAGDPACTAQIGRSLAVDEVLLVGMSQLGDVVLSLQRVDAVAGQVLSQLSAVVPAGGDVSEAQIDGWLKQLYPAEVFKRYGFISVKSDVEGARVTINGEPRGETPMADRVQVLASRNYRVELAKDGHVPFSARIDVPPDATVEVNARLPESSRPTPWYKRGYVWGVVGGVVAVGVAVGTAVYFTRPDAEHDSAYVVLPQHM